MNNKQKLLTATAITGTIVSASAFTVFDYAICRRKKQPDVRKKEKWKPYLDYVLKDMRRRRKICGNICCTAGKFVV